MKSILGLTLVILFSYFFKPKNKGYTNSLITKQCAKKDSLFELDIRLKENFVRIKAPKKLDFELPDHASKIKLIKVHDFNADSKEDIMVYLGACGTGGCMYGVFLNQYKNFYRLAYIDYLNNFELKKDKNGYTVIKSYEEAEPYNPSKIYVSKFKFDKEEYQYKLDTAYIYIDEKNMDYRK
ncbi:hypothetical protein [Tenacibaculum sp. Ill]|uniref:hypothetical protein n=1 Tax=Tenacibaculum sp. Ill TaxID=3445935 RepID=UPI003F795366